MLRKVLTTLMVAAVSVGVGFGAGWGMRGAIGGTLVGGEAVSQPALPPASEGNLVNRKGRVAEWDGKAMTVIFEGGESQKYAKGEAEVWVMPVGASDSALPVRADWQAVAKGREVTVASNKTEGSLEAVLVY